MRDVKNSRRPTLEDVLTGVPAQRASRECPKVLAETSDPGSAIRNCLETPRHEPSGALAGTAHIDTRAPLNQRPTASTGWFCPVTSELSVPVGPNDAVGMLGFL